MHSPPSLVITCLPVNEALPQRPAPAAQVAHALPGHKGRPREEALQVLVRQPKLRPHALPHRLLACMDQRSLSWRCKLLRWYACPGILSSTGPNT